jgi:8-oxo-dGTP pyrophosphatase MutT (NUDIX family)
VRKYCVVATAFVVREGRTLLLKHKKLGLWLPPGGHIDEGETPDEAVLREVREETGLEASFVAPPHAAVSSLPRVEPLHAPQLVQVEEIPGHNHHIDLIYFLKAAPGEVRPGAGESGEWRWHSAEELGEPHVNEEIRASGRKAIEFVSSRS